MLASMGMPKAILYYTCFGGNLTHLRTTALYPILALLIARVSTPNIGTDASGSGSGKQQAISQTGPRANCTTVLDPRHNT